MNDGATKATGAERQYLQLRVLRTKNMQEGRKAVFIIDNLCIHARVLR